jgi:hypothetical protein
MRANPFRSATLHVDVDGNTVTCADLTVGDATGDQMLVLDRA